MIFNQFEELGNPLWHYVVTGSAAEEALREHLGPGDRVAGFVGSSGSAGTLGAGYYLKARFPGAKLAVAEALQCPTLLLNGFGDHRIEGIGDKHVPWVHDCRNTDFIIAVDDEAPMRLIRLFNVGVGRGAVTAAGVPEAGMSFFPERASAGELVALAWLLEEGSRRFYTALSVDMPDGETIRLFLELATAEEHHKDSLLGLYRDVTNSEPGPDFPRDIVPTDEARMEGGVKVREALVWAKGKAARELLELSVALETDSYDLYIKMGRRVSGEKAKRIFDHLIEEERNHLARLAAQLDKGL
jgi:rubrerythrin